MGQKKEDVPLKNITTNEVKELADLLQRNALATMVILDESGIVENETEGRRIIRKLFFYSEEIPWKNLIILSSCEMFIACLMKEGKGRIRVYNHWLIDEKVPEKFSEQKLMDVYILPAFGRKSIWAMVRKHISVLKCAGAFTVAGALALLAIEYIPDLLNWAEIAAKWESLPLPPIVRSILLVFAGLCLGWGFFWVCRWLFYKQDRACMRALGENADLKVIVTGKVNERKAKYIWERWVRMNKMNTENGTRRISNYVSINNTQDQLPPLIFDTEGEPREGIRYLEGVIEYHRMRDIWDKMF